MNDSVKATVASLLNVECRLTFAGGEVIYATPSKLGDRHFIASERGTERPLSISIVDLRDIQRAGEHRRSLDLNSPPRRAAETEPS